MIFVSVRGFLSGFRKFVVRKSDEVVFYQDSRRRRSMCLDDRSDELQGQGMRDLYSWNPSVSSAAGTRISLTTESILKPRRHDRHDISLVSVQKADK